MVLFVLFHACPLLAAQLLGSGTYVAMDNFFTSPILFLCLLLQGVFAVGTLRDIHRGASHAGRYWRVTMQNLKRRGDMDFARFGFLTFAQWLDKRLVRLVSTTHVKKEHFIPLPHG